MKSNFLKKILGLPTESDNLNTKGNEAFEHNNYDLAIDYYKKALEKNSSHERALKNIILAYIKLGKYGNAKYYYEKLKEMSPKTVNLLNNIKPKLTEIEDDKYTNQNDNELDTNFEKMLKSHLYKTYLIDTKKITRNDKVLKNIYSEYSKLVDKNLEPEQGTSEKYTATKVEEKYPDVDFEKIQATLLQNLATLEAKNRDKRRSPEENHSIKSVKLFINFSPSKDESEYELFQSKINKSHHVQGTFKNDRLINYRKRNIQDINYHTVQTEKDDSLINLN